MAEKCERCRKAGQDDMAVAMNVPLCLDCRVEYRNMLEGRLTRIRNEVENVRMLTTRRYNTSDADGLDAILKNMEGSLEGLKK